MASKLDVDRYGVPQYCGEPELYEEYAERCWDLWYGRLGSDQLQVATPVHLRSGLTGSAYNAVRKLEHTSLITKDTEGKPFEKGLTLLLKTLRDNIEQEAPVKTNELFFGAFYSPQVWRLQTESMQQYIVRREQDFQRLEENLAGSKIPDHIRAMMLLAFGGLDSREQLNVLASVNNEYDFKKISHALRIQYPSCSGKPVHRRDYLGCGRSSSSALPPSTKMKPKYSGQRHFGKGRKGYAMVTYEDEEEKDEGEDAYFEDDEAIVDEEALEADGYSDDDALEAMVLDYDFADETELADAFAAIMQRKKMARPQGTSKGGKPQSFNFQAKGEVTLDQRAKAIKFLKSVTPCTSCGQKGHWAGDVECPNAKKGGKGNRPTSPKKKTFPKKKASSTFFVQDGDAETLLAADSKTPVDGEVLAVVPVDSLGPSFDKFSNHFEIDSNESEVLMVLKTEDLCEHSSYKGGNERNFHRSANGHVRQFWCKEPECNKAVITGRRREPLTLWKYLVQVALCAKQGSKARSRELFQRVTTVRLAALEERETELRAGPPPKQQGHASPPGAAGSWLVVASPSSAPASPYPASQASSSSSFVAKIVRDDQVVEQRIWVYGVCVAPSLELPPFPELSAEDSDVLSALPSDGTRLGPDTQDV